MHSQVNMPDQHNIFTWEGNFFLNKMLQVDSSLGEL